MFCRKCGTSLPDGSSFCSNCGSSQEENSSFEKTLPAVVKPHQSSPSRIDSMHCRTCGKPLATKWEKCPYCNTPNPFYIRPDEPRQSQEPQQPVKQEQQQPQVVLQNYIVEEKTGCGTIIGRIIGVIFIIGLISGLLSQCGVG